MSGKAKVIKSHSVLPNSVPTTVLVTGRLKFRVFNGPMSQQKQNSGCPVMFAMFDSKHSQNAFLP